MKECTFRPKTLTKSYKNLINQTNLKAIRGFDSFIHKVEYIKNKKKE
jgi:DNA-binding transcriptional regulator YhcF (GntR family)